MTHRNKRRVGLEKEEEKNGFEHELNPPTYKLMHFSDSC